MLAISIISGIFFIYNYLLWMAEEHAQVVSIGAIFVISVWNLCFPLAVIAMALYAIFLVANIIKGINKL